MATNSTLKTVATIMDPSLPVTSKSVGSTEGCWMKVLVVDSTGAVVNGRPVASRNVGGTGDGGTGKLVGSTEGCWMKELEVDGAIAVGTVV